MSLENRKKVHKRRYGFFGIIIIIFLIGCSEKELTKEEAIEQTLEKLNELESYAFTIHTNSVDGMENEIETELTGEVINKPFHASIDIIKGDFEGDYNKGFKPYYKGDRIYFEHPEFDYLIKEDVAGQTDFSKAVEELTKTPEELSFSVEEDYYFFEFKGKDIEKNKEILDVIYPAFAYSSSPERAAGHAISEGMVNLVDVLINLKVSKSNLSLTELYLEYKAESKLFKDNPPQILEDITLVLSNHNEIQEIDTPSHKTDHAKSYMEHFMYSFFGDDNIFDADGSLDDNMEVLEKEEKLQNPASNFMNYNMLASDDEWIYFENLNQGIDRIRMDGSKRERISENVGKYFNVIDDQLFYLIDRTVYHMDKGGNSEPQSIDGIKATNLFVKDNTLYYITSSDDPPGQVTHLEKYDLNLGYSDRLLENVSEFLIVEDKIYYQKVFDPFIYVTDVDVSLFTQEQEESLNIQARDFIILDNWLYYENVERNHQLYRKSLETGQIEELTTDPASGLNGTDNIIYYINTTDDFSLYRYDVNTQQNEKMDQGQGQTPHIINGDLYYLKKGENIGWYRLSKAGGEPELVMPLQTE